MSNVPTSSKLQTLSEALKKAAPAMSAVAAKMVTPDKLIKIAVAAAQRTPLLLDCTPASIVRSVIQGAELGLTPGSALNQAYLVPFKNTTNNCWDAQLIVSAQGFCELAYRSGLIQSVQIECVYEGDDFEFEYGLNPVLRHVPKGESDKITHAYAIAIMKDGAASYRVMNRRQLDKVKASSASVKAGRGGPWKDWEEEMFRKTVAKNASKYWPKSIEVARAVALDNAQESGDYSIMDFETPDALPEGAYDAEATDTTVKAVSGRIKAATDDSPLTPFGFVGNEEHDFRAIAESNGKNLEEVAAVVEPKTKEALEAALNGQEPLL